MRRKKKSINTTLLTTTYTCFQKDCPQFIPPSYKNKMFYTSYKQKKINTGQLQPFWLTSEAISSCSHALKHIPALLSPSKAAQHCTNSLTVIKQLISFYLILNSNKMLLAGGGFNASLLVALTRCLLIVTVKAKRLTRLGWDAAACQVFSFWLMEQSQLKLSGFSHQQLFLATWKLDFP